MKNFTLIILIGFGTFLQAQNIGINTTGTAPNSSAMLDVDATNKGLLIPRVSLTSPTDNTTITTPATSLLVYSTNTNATQMPDGVGFYYWDATKWIKLMTIGGSNNAWLTTGNSGTTDGTDFLGTIDTVPLTFKINNQKAGRIEYYTGANGKFGNTALGFQSLFNNTIGFGNVANGYQTLYSNTTGGLNIATGTFSLFSNTEGVNNIASGHEALFSNTIGANNIANGYQALNKNTTAFNNIANGYQALYSNTTGLNNIANGYQALYSNTTGSNNIANGYNAMRNNRTGYNNVAIGKYALYHNKTIGDLVAIGDSALFYNGTGSFDGVGGYNTAVGCRALLNNRMGIWNSAYGYFALYSNSNGGYNTATGYESLYYNTEGDANTAIGSRALHSNRIGARNTTIGSDALYSNTSGDENTAIGSNAIFSNTTGNNNIAIGFLSGSSLTTGDNNIFIGCNVQPNISNTGSNQLNIGNWIYGDNGNIGINDATPDTKLHVVGGTRISENSTTALGTIFKQIQAGNTNGGDSGTNTKTVIITFPNSFATTPHLNVTPRNQTGSGFTNQFAVTIISVSTTSASVIIKRLDTPGGWGQNLELEWMAFSY